jgi:hypothetical protein
MSIYPVKLSEWYPPGDTYYENCTEIVKFNRCLACGDSINYSKAIGHHSLIYGHGDIWCSLKCCKSNKKAKLDKRRHRRFKREHGRFFLSFL